MAVWIANPITKQIFLLSPHVLRKTNYGWLYLVSVDWIGGSVKQARGMLGSMAEQGTAEHASHSSDSHRPHLTVKDYRSGPLWKIK